MTINGRLLAPLGDMPMKFASVRFINCKGVIKKLMRTVETVDRKTRDGSGEQRARGF
jgi:hypothetical protein